jgi:hypothetical protein
MATTRVQQIIEAIEQLSPDEMEQLTAWFDQHVSDAWDRQIIEDFHAGRLDEKRRSAENAANQGRLHDLP